MASADLFIRAGDTTPVFTDTILDASGNVYNLTGKTVTFTLRSLKATASVALQGAASVTNAAAGKVQFAWAAGDTALAGAGLFNAEWRVVQDSYTFPNDGYRTISIEPSLASVSQQLVSLADVKDYLTAFNIGVDRSHDVKLMRYIEAATLMVENVTGPVIVRQFEEWHDGGSTYIMLRRRPSSAIGCTPVITLVACSEYNGPIEWPLAIIASPDKGQLYSCMLDAKLGRVVRRTAGGGVQGFPHQPQAVHVVYTAGQQTVPPNVALAACEAIRDHYQTTMATGAGSRTIADIQEYLGPRSAFAELVDSHARKLLAPMRRHPALA